MHNHIYHFQMLAIHKRWEIHNPISGTSSYLHLHLQVINKTFAKTPTTKRLFQTKSSNHQLGKWISCNNSDKYIWDKRRVLVHKWKHHRFPFIFWHPFPTLWNFWSIIRRNGGSKGTSAPMTIWPATPMTIWPAQKTRHLSEHCSRKPMGCIRF